VKFCHQCGHKLDQGIESFCPICGFNLKLAQPRENWSKIGISDTKGDVIAAGLTGDNNLIAKDTAGNITYIKIDTITTEQLKNLISYSPALSASSLSSKENTSSDVADFKKEKETKQQTVQVLESINKIEKERGNKIQEIRFDNLKISKNELELRDFLLQGNEYYYKKEFQKAIEWYDKALEIDPNNVNVLYNKGVALGELDKYQETIERYDTSDYTNHIFEDYTQFQIFIVTYLYAKDLEQIKSGGKFGNVEMDLEEIVTIAPAEGLPPDADLMSHQIHRLLIDHLLDSSNWDTYGFKRFRLNPINGVILVRRYLSTLVSPLKVQPYNSFGKIKIDEKLNRTEGKNEVKNYFRELFDKLKEKSQEEMIEGLISGAKQYGPTALSFLIRMVNV
jgi:tetratricopeptide (TPR) repeat protein